MGASGFWCGSVWLTTTEAETTPTVKQKMLEATSANTVRSRSRTGKPTRQLQSAWSDAWSSKDAPEPLEMPLQGILSRPAMVKVDKLAEGGHEGAKEIASRSEEHTSELQSLMRISYAVFCLKKKKKH